MRSTEFFKLLTTGEAVKVFNKVWMFYIFFTGRIVTRFWQKIFRKRLNLDEKNSRFSNLILIKLCIGLFGALFTSNIPNDNNHYDYDDKGNAGFMSYL